MLMMPATRDAATNPAHVLQTSSLHLHLQVSVAGGPSFSGPIDPPAVLCANIGSLYAAGAVNPEDKFLDEGELVRLNGFLESETDRLEVAGSLSASSPSHAPLAAALLTGRPAFQGHCTLLHMPHPGPWQLPSLPVVALPSPLYCRRHPPWEYHRRPLRQLPAGHRHQLQRLPLRVRPRPTSSSCHCCTGCRGALPMTFLSPSVWRPAFFYHRIPTRAPASCSPAGSRVLPLLHSQS